MMNVLVSGASGIVGYGVLRSLKRSGKALRLVGTTIHPDSVAPAFCDVFEQAVPTADAGYLPWLKATIRKHRVDFMIPGIEIDMYEWAAHAAEIEQSGARMLLNNVELISLCRDKWTFYEKLKTFHTPYAIETSLVADFEALTQALGLPFLLKPRRGFGARGIVRVDSAETFARHRQDVGPSLMAQPIVGRDDEEYTTAVFADGSGGFFAKMTLKRRLAADGFTERAEVVESDALNDAVSDLCRRFVPLGPTNFQFRKDGGTFKLLEINPRVSSSTSIRAAFGYNEAGMAIEYFLENKTPVQPVIRRGRAVRYVEDAIFFDDL